MNEDDAIRTARLTWAEADQFKRAGGGWTFRVSGGYAWIMDSGDISTDPSNTREHARWKMTHSARGPQEHQEQAARPATPPAQDIPNDISSTLFVLHGELMTERGRALDHARGAKDDSGLIAEQSRADAFWYAAERVLHMIKAVQQSREKAAYPTRPGTTVRLTNGTTLHTLTGTADPDGSWLEFVSKGKRHLIPANRVQDVTENLPDCPGCGPGCTNREHAKMYRAAGY